MEKTLFLSQPNKYLAKPVPEFLESSFTALLASFRLISEDNFSQTVSLLHNSIELTLKGELAKKNPLLIVDSKKPEKTIHFDEALKRNKEDYPELIKAWEGKIKDLHNCRNQIIHAGSNLEDNGKYISLITSVAIPFLNDFFWVSNQVSLERELRPEIFREFLVAQKVSEKLTSERLPLQSYIFRTLKWKILQENSLMSEPEGEAGYKASFEKDYILGEQAEKAINREWVDDYFVEVFCKICDSVRTFVKVEPIKKPKLGLKPIALYCPICGLKITEKEKYLTEYHIGEVEQDIVDKFFDENSEALKYDGLVKSAAAQQSVRLTLGSVRKVAQIISSYRKTYMRVLDIDLDFFLSKAATFVYGDDRLLESDGYYPWDEEGVRNFLENNCGLNKNNPIKGTKFVQHHEVFVYLRKLILEGKLQPPIEVVHVDAHADLGLGDASWKYIIGDILHRPINERYFPEIGGWSGLNEGNFLAFALACRWIKKLVYVHHPDAGDDTIHFYCRDFDENSGYLEMPKYDSNLLSNPYFYKDHKPKSFEPIVPYAVIEGTKYYSDERFSYAFLTQSPKYTPRSSDSLIPVIMEYIDIIETG